ncbi:hypothetical protein [Polyangium sorediatum]|uniref:Lipoprotein n=1 Tax=Polyangium sorediatum TaxID=889274 RepID=A0ABT6P456_9BACT|nr:hypothetical protein [Polyangium sorediatum]MDI1435389.1 hypothetical protein [Polyangium sorediatum]
MRITVVVLVAIHGLLTTSCGHSESNRITLPRGEVQRVEECHLLLDFAPISPKGVPFADMRYVCGVSESALKQQEWWGDKPQPLAFALKQGDCIPLDTAYYCVEAIEPGTSVTLKATYKKPRRPEHMLERLP